MVPALGFVPFGDGAEMRIVEACGGFGTDFAAADGGIKFAVKGDDGLFELEAEGGDGGGEVARGIAVFGSVRPLGAGQDDGFTQTLQGKREEVGGVRHAVRAVQYQNAVAGRQFGGDDVQPVAPVLQRDGRRINQWIADVPLEVEVV